MVKRPDHLDKLLAEVRDFSQSRNLQTEEGRMLTSFLQRLIEIDRFGEPKTDPIKRHHE